MILDVLNYIVSLYGSIGNSVFSFYADNSRFMLDSMHAAFKFSFNVLIGLTILLATIYVVVSLFVLRKKKSDYALKGSPFVTVQIPTFNEVAAINCAKRVIEGDYPKNRLQVIIGDDSNVPSVSARIDKFANEINSQYPDLVMVTRRGSNVGFKPGNLNHMLKFTKGEFIVIFDSDFLPDKDFVPRIIAPFTNDSKISGVQARWKISNFNQNIASVLGGSINALCHQIMLAFMNRIDATSMLCGSAEAVRKSDLVSLGGWTSGSLTEDIEFSLRLVNRGKKIIYLEDLESECEVPHTVNDLCKQQMRWGFGVISALKQHLGAMLVSKKVRLRDKYAILLFTSGYTFAMLLFLITILGVLSLVSDRPAPIDWARFLTESSINLALTSGFLIATIIATVLSRNASKIPKLFAAALSVGLVVTFYVNVGIIKALFGRDMKWFMLKKNGNR